MIETTKSISIYKRDDLKVMLVTNGHDLDAVLEAMDCAIRGHGFFPKGTLVYQDEE